MHYGSWPWKELQLVAKDPLVTHTWKHWLRKYLAHHNTTPLSRLDQWLLARYTELSSRLSESVHAVYAVKSFTGYRLWKASQVSGCEGYSSSSVALTVHTMYCICSAKFTEYDHRYCYIFSITIRRH